MALLAGAVGLSVVNLGLQIASDVLQKELQEKYAHYNATVDQYMVAYRYVTQSYNHSIEYKNFTDKWLAVLHFLRYIELDAKQEAIYVGKYNWQLAIAQAVIQLFADITMTYALIKNKIVEPPEVPKRVKVDVENEGFKAKENVTEKIGGEAGEAGGKGMIESEWKWIKNNKLAAGAMALVIVTEIMSMANLSIAIDDMRHAKSEIEDNQKILDAALVTANTQKASYEEQMKKIFSQMENLFHFFNLTSFLPNNFSFDVATLDTVFFTIWKHDLRNMNDHFINALMYWFADPTASLETQKEQSVKGYESMIKFRDDDEVMFDFQLYFNNGTKLSKRSYEWCVAHIYSRLVKKVKKLFDVTNKYLARAKEYYRDHPKGLPVSFNQGNDTDENNKFYIALHIYQVGGFFSLIDFDGYSGDDFPAGDLKRT